MHHRKFTIASFVALGLIASSAAAITPHPTADIPWSPNQFWNIPVSEIEIAFNNARDQEAIQLSIALPHLTMPSQAAWDAMTDNEKVLFLVNDERLARNIPAFEGSDSQVTGVAQGFADTLLANDEWGHYQDVDGDQVLEGPWDRLFDDPAIAPPDLAACHEFLSRAENLSVFVSSSTSYPPDEPVAQSVYLWLYDDSGSSWGHRDACFVEPLQDDSGTMGVEGLIGIGIASGGPYQGPFGSPWPSAVLVVFNFFDPCSSWDFGTVSAPAAPRPAIAEIHGAFPNPFGPSTRVAFDVVRAGRVELAVYDLAGRRVRRLTDRTFSAGRYDVLWDGADERGKRVAAGTYFVRLRAADQVSTTKLTLEQ